MLNIGNLVTITSGIFEIWDLKRSRLHMFMKIKACTIVCLSVDNVIIACSTSLDTPLIDFKVENYSDLPPYELGSSWNLLHGFQFVEKGFESEETVQWVPYRVHQIEHIENIRLHIYFLMMDGTPITFVIRRGAVSKINPASNSN